MDELLLEKELKQIDEKLRLKNIQLKESPKYKLLEDNELWRKKNDKERESRLLERYIYQKYIIKPQSKWGEGFYIKNIKSAVKQGIKDGLGTTNVLFINEYDLRMIVKQLIDKDLEKIKTKTDVLRNEIKDINAKIQINIEEKKKLVDASLNRLRKQRIKINNKLNQKEYLKNKRIEEKQKEVKIKVNDLPKFMDKIIKEVDKRLILESLSGE